MKSGRSVVSVLLALAGTIAGCNGTEFTSPNAEPIIGTAPSPSLASGIQVTFVPSTLQIGQTGWVRAILPDGNQAASPTWVSSNPGVAYVNSLGQVSGVANGTAVITATVDGLTAAGTITVGSGGGTPTPSGELVVTLDPSTLQIGQTGWVRATLADGNQAASPTWGSSTRRTRY